MIKKLNYKELSLDINLMDINLQNYKLYIDSKLSIVEDNTLVYLIKPIQRTNPLLSLYEYRLQKR